MYKPRRTIKSLMKKNSKKKDHKDTPKESVEEFLQRGGKITRIPVPQTQLDGLKLITKRRDRRTGKLVSYWA